MIRFTFWYVFAHALSLLALSPSPLWGQQEEEAVTSALEAFKLQGVDLSCIVKARSGGNTDKCASLYTSRWLCARAQATLYLTMWLQLYHDFLQNNNGEVITTA